jgi:hypothetical protein
MAKQRSIIDILLQTGRGGYVDCPKCGINQYHGPSVLRRTKGVCNKCKPPKVAPKSPPEVPYGYVEKTNAPTIKFDLDRVFRPEIPKPIKRAKRSNRKAVPLDTKKQLADFCWLCGSREYLHTHHKNRDSSDNRLENLVVLCETCHCSVHFNEPVFKAMVAGWFNKLGIIPDLKNSGSGLEF